MAEIINLRQARKQKKRADKSAIAETNRVAYGRKKTEKQLTEAEKSKVKKDLDHKKLTD